MVEKPKTSLMVLGFSKGFGQTVFFAGSEKYPPRFRSAGTFLGEEGEALSIAIPPKCYDNVVAMVILGGSTICEVTDDPRYGRRYLFTKQITDQLVGDNSLLLAQVSAMVHEAIAAEATHNPSDYAGTIPVGV